MAQVQLESLTNDGSIVREEDHISSEPLVEIYSINLYSNSFVSKKRCCEVYGTIIINDGGSTEVCEIYNRPKSNPEAVSVDNRELTLTGHKYSKIGKMNMPVIHVTLKDKITGSLIVQGSTPLDNTTIASGSKYFEEYRHEIIASNSGGYVIIKYVALSFGVFAQVKVELMLAGDTKKKMDRVAGSGEILEDNEEALDVFGSIHSHFGGKTYRCNASENQRHHLRSRLFHKLGFESERVTFGSPIPLCREFLAVPSYSDLIFNLDLKDRGSGNQIASGDIVFKDDSCGCLEKASKKQGFGDVYVLVSVQWHELISLESEEQGEPSVEGLYEPIFDGERLLRGVEHIEVFSVFMGREDHKPLSIYGRIFAVDCRGKFDVFARGENEPEILQIKDNLLPLSGPPSALVLGDSFYISVALKDSEGRAVIKGEITESVGMVRREAKWFDRRFCAVIKGKGGFAAVHYMVFDYAIRARVTVQIISSSPVTLHGHVVTSYSEHAYDTEYEKQYYRSWLLNLSEANAIKVAPNSKLPLLKSIVPVPVGSSVIVDVEISAADQSSHETMTDRLEFSLAEGDKAPKKIRRGSLALLVSVAWC